MVFELISIVILCHIFRRKDWWGLCLPIGTVSESRVAAAPLESKNFADVLMLVALTPCLVQGIGYVNRVKFGDKPTFELYFTGEVFVTVAPVAYLAFSEYLCQRLGCVATHGDMDPDYFSGDRLHHSWSDAVQPGA